MLLREQDLFITAAREVDVSNARKAIIIHVPFRLLKSFHRIQQRLIRELEKKFSGKHVCVIAQRRICEYLFARLHTIACRG